MLFTGVVLAGGRARPPEVVPRATGCSEIARLRPAADLAEAGAPLETVWGAAHIAGPRRAAEAVDLDCWALIQLADALEAAAPGHPKDEAERWLELWSWAQSGSRGSVLATMVGLSVELRAVDALEALLPALGPDRQEVVGRALDRLDAAPELDLEGERLTFARMLNETDWVGWVPTPVCLHVQELESTAIEAILDGEHEDRVSRLRALAAEPPSLLEWAGADGCSAGLAGLAADWVEDRERMARRVADTW